jgi:O-antigen ligase
MSLAIPYRNTQESARPPLALIALLALIAAALGVWVWLNPGDLNPFWVIALPLLAALIWRRPVFGVYVAVAAALVLEQYDIIGLSDPLTGRLPFYLNIDSWTDLKWLTANPLELLLAWTGLAWYVREHRALGTPLRLGRIGGVLLLFLGAVAFAWGFGLLTGGDFKTSLWEIRALFYMGACYLLATNLLKSPGQVRILGWILILGIGLKALQGIYRYIVPFGGDLTDIYAVTGHEDALFFDTMLILALAFAVYGGPIRQRLALWGLTPALAITLLLTRRRAALVAIGVGLVSFLVTLPPARRAILPKLFVPLFLLGLVYVGAFYNSDSALAKPIQLVKSLYAPSDPRDASSNQYRDIEQYNVMTTIRHNPILGIGFGNRYEQPVPLVPIEFPLRDWIPHNEILWIWLKMGTLGFIIFWLFIGSAIIQGSLILRKLRDPYFQALAAMIIAFVLMQVIIAYADLQLTFYRNMIYLGIMLGVLVRLEALDGVASSEPRVPSGEQRVADA